MVSITNFYYKLQPANSFAQNFDAVTVPALPICWSKIVRGATIASLASVETNTAITNSAPNAVRLYNSSSQPIDDIILVSPLIGNLGAGTNRLTFYAANTSAAEDLEIGTLSDIYIYSHLYCSGDG